MFNVIIWGNYSSSKTDESTNSNTTALYFRTYAGWANIEHEKLYIHKQRPAFGLYQTNELPYNWTQSQ